MEALKIKEKIIRENAFEHEEEKPGLSANRPSNNWALDVRSMVVRTLDGRPLVIKTAGCKTLVVTPLELRPLDFNMFY